MNAFVLRPRLRALAGYRGVHLQLWDARGPATFGDVLQGLSAGSARTGGLATALAGLSYAAMRFECPALTETILQRAFECVVLEAHLPGCPDATPFRAHFDLAPPGARVVRFDNLGGDAVLVAPLPMADARVYPHLATFLRGAPRAQIDAFFALLTQEALRAAATQTVWMNTAGGGVNWVHGRVDSWPKYYGYGAYRAGLPGF